MVHSIRNAVRLVAAAALALLLASCGGSSNDSPAPPPLFSKTYVFGASVSDTGNACNLIPSSCTPNPPYASPRWSNGPVFAQLLAARYGGSAAPSRLGGTNFAYGGARTGAIAGTTQSVPNMVTQVNTFLAGVNYQANPQYLYVLDLVTVGNDIVDALTQSATNPNAPATILTGAVTNAFNMVLQLYAAGARHIVITNSTDIGKTPQAQALGPAAVAGATQMSNQFNAALAQQLPALRAANPGLNLYFVDVGAFTAQAMANPAALGYTNVSAPCFNNLLPTPTLCTSPDTYFYWDSFHPTAYTHTLVYQRAAAAIGI
jgi:phospholipase/lecithinase/hemolysin